MPTTTILDSQRRQKVTGESVQYQETFVGNAIALHTFSNASSVLIVDTAKIVRFGDAFSPPVMYTDSCDR